MQTLEKAKRNIIRATMDTEIGIPRRYMHFANISTQMHYFGFIAQVAKFPPPISSDFGSFLMSQIRP